MIRAFILTVSTLMLLGIWQLTANIINQPELFPGVAALFNSLFSLFSTGTFYVAVGMTLLRGCIGIFIALCFALLSSIIFSRNPFIFMFCRPWLTLMRSVPVISFILLALILFNPESIPLLIGFLTMFPILTSNLMEGFIYLDEDLRKMGKLFRLSRYNYYTQVIYPQLKPYLYSGLASAIGFGWRAIIMGEVLAQCKTGIGSEMKQAQLFIDIPELLSWTVIAVAIGLLADGGIELLEKWQPAIRFAQKDKMNPATLSELLPAPIKVKNISFTYLLEQTPTLENLTFIIGAEERIGISAPSGAGKTTLLKLLTGMYKPQKGSIEIEKEMPVSCVFDKPCLLSHLSAIENVALPLANILTRETAFTYASIPFTEMEIEDLTDSSIDELSYGQLQRIAIFRALMYPAPLLLLDEPFKGLDKETVERVIKEIQTRSERTKRTILFTSHQPDELKLFATRILTLN